MALNSPDKFTRTPTAMHTIVYSLPASRGTGSLRYSNSLEPLRELETVRIKKHSCFKASDIHYDVLFMDIKFVSPV